MEMIARAFGRLLIGLALVQWLTPAAAGAVDVARWFFGATPLMPWDEPRAWFAVLWTLPCGFFVALLLGRVGLFLMQEADLLRNDGRGS